MKDQGKEPNSLKRSFVSSGLMKGPFRAVFLMLKLYLMVLFLAGKFLDYA